MPHIYQMSPQLSNLIAAGEVVERPGSVVKELVENAVDAGAKHVTVELKHGGVTYIRVTDDGCGILPEDARTAFLRHATSKIRTERELAAIGTLGFRGEALAAIASVSRVDLFTRTADRTEGVQLSLEAGEETGWGETGCPVGTTIVVRDLFFNVPARAKFLKKDATEGAFAESLLTQVAIARPGVAFRFIKDGRESFSTPGDGKMLSAIYACAGRELAGNLTAISGQVGDIAVGGYISRPECSRANRSQQSFYINGRYIRSRLLSAAVEEAYKGKMTVGRYPVCFLELRLSPGVVDVNVHPAKLEVKFSREKEVFSAVYHCVVSALEAGEELAQLRARPSALAPREDRVTREQQELELPRPRETLSYTRPAVAQEPPAGRRPGYTFAETFQAAQGKVASSSSPRLPYQTARSAPAEPASLRPEKPGEDAPVDLLTGVYGSKREAPAEQPAVPAKPEEKAVFEEAKPAASAVAPEEKRPAPPVSPAETGEEILDLGLPSAPAEEPAENTAEASEPEPKKGPWVRVLGEAFHTYIIAEDAEGLWLIDKHAAHEKMLFDRLRAGRGEEGRQLLLEPVTVSLTPALMQVCLDNRDLLEKAGFSVEEFGRGDLLVREAPMYLAEGDIPFVVSDMAERLSRFRGAENEILDDLLKSVACKAAVKAGMDTSVQELQAFAQTVLDDDSIRNCPHGRPCVTYLSRYQLEKLFKRVL